VTLDVGREDEVAAALAERRIIVDARPGAGIRVGPHFYNNTADLDRFKKGLMEVLGR
jgi:kynureninase